VMPELLAAPVNVVRLTLHPKGLAARIANLAEWRAHMLSRLRHQIDMTADGELTALLEEAAAYPWPHAERRSIEEVRGAESVAQTVAIPLQIRTAAGQLSFLSTTTLFGNPFDVTVAEIAIESFFPADAETPMRVAELAAMGGVAHHGG